LASSRVPSSPGGGAMHLLGPSSLSADEGFPRCDDDVLPAT
jgi:hypothetical protein